VTLEKENVDPAGRVRAGGPAEDVFLPFFLWAYFYRLARRRIDQSVISQTDTCLCG